jgi:hypothetical protein
MRAVSAMARFTFIQLWLVADDAGRLVPTRNFARRLYPGDAEAAALLPGWLAELEREHCIERYCVDDTNYLRIVNWHRHQKIYHPTPSRLPPRPVGARQDSGEPREVLGSDREPLGREGEKPNDDKGLIPPAQTPERFATLASRSERVGQNPCAPGLSPGFTSASRGDGFLRRMAAVWTGRRP